MSVVSPGFGIEHKVNYPLGLSVADIAKREFGALDGVVALIRCPEGSAQKWEVIPRELWHLSKPKGQGVLKLYCPPSGGDNTFAIIAAVVVSIAAPYLAGAALGLTASAAAATVAGQVLIAGITIGANALLGSLFAPSAQSVVPKAEQEQQQIANVDADTNILAKDGRLPRVLGERRISPPDICYPHRYLEGGREVIEKVVALEGHHSITDIRIDNVLIDSIAGVEYETTDGKITSGQQSLVTRVSKPIAIGKRLSGFSIKEGTDKLTDQTSSENSEPAPIVFAPGYHESMEQITLRLGLAAFADPSSATTKARQPVRVRFWKVSDPSTKYSLDEIHIIGRVLGESLKEIRFRWDDNFGKATASKDFSYQFWNTVPAADVTLSDGSTGTQWTGSSGIAITQTGDGLNVLLDEATYPKDEYEFEIIGGLPVDDTDFNSGTYALNGTIYSLFKSYVDDSKLIPAGQRGVTAGVTCQFATLVVDQRPVQRPGVAEIAVKVKNVDAKNVTCTAAAYINDWSGSAWDVETTSTNPASHSYNLLHEWLNLFGVDTDLINSSRFVDWRTECASQGYRASFIATGQAVIEVLDNLMTAGFATKTLEDGYSVDWFRDRTSDTAEMTFSPRDSRTSIDRSFAESPKGFRCRFNDRASNWSEAELVFNNPYGNSSFAENEALDYPSIDDADLIKRRATFDMLQLAYRERRWKISAGPAAFSLSKGSLINMVTDLDNDYSHGFFVKSVTDARTIVVDRIVQEQETDWLENTDPLEDETDLFAVGSVSVALILMQGGVEEYVVQDATNNVITLTTDLSSTDIVGTRLNIGPRSRFMRRGIVLNVARQSQERALLTVVDEAPEIYTEMNRLFG